MTYLNEQDRETVRRRVHEADDRMARSFALLDVMHEVAQEPDAEELRVLAKFVRWSDQHREASVEIALDAVEGIVAAKVAEVLREVERQIRASRPAPSSHLRWESGRDRAARIVREVAAQNEARSEATS